MVQQGRLSIAEHYHQETKYSEHGVVPSSSLDAISPKGPFKEFLSEHAIDLTPFLPFPNFPATGEKRPATVPEVATSSLLARISRLLYFSYGVTGLARAPDGVHLFRAAPSAGALYPAEMYVVTRDVEGVDNGLHNYLGRQHQLVPVFDGDLHGELERIGFEHPALRHAPAILVLTANYYRSAWRYRERCYRRALLDTGHLLGNICLYAPQEGLLAVPLAGFMDDDANRLLFLNAGEEDVFLLVPLVPLALPVRNVELRAPLLRSGVSTYEEQGDTVLFHAFHRASSIHERAPAPVAAVELRNGTPPPDRIPLKDTLSDLGAALPSVIARRRSTRRFSGREIPLSGLAKVLSFASTAAIEEAPVRTLQVPNSLETYVIAQGVTGLVPGIYRYSIEEHDLVPMKRGRFRDQVRHFCMEQQLGQNAAAVVVHTAHLRRALETYGERAYRYLHMDAGLFGQCMNLAALHLGLGASGIGGFYDDEINELLGLSLEHAVVYVTVLGDPVQVA